MFSCREQPCLFIMVWFFFHNHNLRRFEDEGYSRIRALRIESSNQRLLEVSPRHYRFISQHLRPKVLHCVKLGNETQVLCPAFALVVFEIPQGPSEERKRQESLCIHRIMTKNFFNFFILQKCSLNSKTTQGYFTVFTVSATTWKTK